MLEGYLEVLLEVVRFETDHVAVRRNRGEALLESTRVAGTYAHLAVLHRRDAVGGAATSATPGDENSPLRASYQHRSTPRIDRFMRALQSFRRSTCEHRREFAPIPSYFNDGGDVSDRT